MPLPLPHFNNQIDPFLPALTNIDPIAYRCDEYDTWDYMEFSEIYRPLWINNGVTFPPKFPITSLNDSIILVERFTPWKYEWCNTYSEQLFNFIKKYTGRDALNDDLLNGKRFDTTLNFGTESIDKTYINNYIIPNSITLTTPKTSVEKQIIITWLIYNEPDFIPESLVKSQLQKTYKKIITSTEKETSITLDLTDFVLCSMVVSSDNLLLKIAIQSQLLDKGYLHSNFQGLLDTIENLIIDAYPRKDLIVSTLDYTFEYTRSANDLDYHATNESIIPSFRLFPEWHYKAYIHYAQNNIWNDTPTALITDGTKPLYKKLLPINNYSLLADTSLRPLVKGQYKSPWRSGERFLPEEYFANVPNMISLGKEKYYGTDPLTKLYFRDWFYLNLNSNAKEPIPLVLRTRQGNYFQHFESTLHYPPLIKGIYGHKFTGIEIMRDIGNREFGSPLNGEPLEPTMVRHVVAESLPGHWELNSTPDSRVNISVNTFSELDNFPHIHIASGTAIIEYATGLLDYNPNINYNEVSKAEMIDNWDRQVAYKEYL